MLTSCCVYAFWTHFSDLAVGCLFAVQLLALNSLGDAAWRWTQRHLWWLLYIRLQQWTESRDLTWNRVPLGRLLYWAEQGGILQWWCLSSLNRWQFRARINYNSRKLSNCLMIYIHIYTHTHIHKYVYKVALVVDISDQIIDGWNKWDLNPDSQIPQHATWQITT